MKVEGDLTNFSPPDLLIFLANLNMEGVLTIIEQTKLITITFDGNSISDAYSERADNKILRSLLLKKILNLNNYRYILQAKKETKMTAGQILKKLKLQTNPKIIEIYKDGIKEVFFELFSLKKGLYNFTQLASGSSKNIIKFNPAAIAIEIASWVDEFKDIERELSTLNRQVVNNSEIQVGKRNETIVLNDLKKPISIRNFIQGSHLPSYIALKTLRNLIAQKKINFLETKIKIKQEKIHDTQMLFQEFKNASRHILISKTINGKMKGLFSFCQVFFHHLFIISMNQNEIIHQYYYYKDADGVLKKRYQKHLKRQILSEPIFSKILESGIAFFGNYFDTNLLTELKNIKNKKYCAIIPYQKKTNSISFLYVLSDREIWDESPFKYLEILSWMVNPIKGLHKMPRAIANAAPANSALKPMTSNSAKTLKQAVQTVNELPPIPYITSSILSLLSNPEYEMDELIRLITQDQSLMSTLIRVSNSILYKGVSEISTVNEAVVRLGVSTIKSIVVASATRALFGSKKSEFNVLSHPLWVHSKECGIISRRIAIECNFKDPEEAFVSGILHDIGKLAILTANENAFKQIIKLQGKSALSACKAEKNILGYTHTQIGEMLMKKWKMPKSLMISVQNHHSHEPGNRTNNSNALSEIVTLGDFYSHMVSAGMDTEQLDRPGHIIKLLSKLGFNDDQETNLMQKIKEDLNETDMLN